MPTCRALDKGSKSNLPLRQYALDALFPPPGGERGPTQQLADQFASFATTIQTRLDVNGGGNGSFGGSVEVQVERAIAQVLRTPVAGGATIGAAVLPPGTATALASPALPPRQEVLRQEARLVVDAVEPIVGRLQQVVPYQHAASDVELFRLIVRQELEALVEELARPEGPRVALVRVLLGGLLGWNAGANDDDSGDVEILTGLVEGRLVVPTRVLEEVLAAVRLLETGGLALVLAWEQYAGNDQHQRLWPASRTTLPSGQEPAVPSLADRINRAAELSPVIAQDVALVAGALDAISFGFAERQSVELELHTLVDFDLVFRTVDRVATVGDVLDWADSIAGRLPQVVEATGQLGMNLAADQADELFWLIEAMYGDRAFQFGDGQQAINRGTGSVPLELFDAQVRRGFLSLARDLDELADLAIFIEADPMEVRR